jgi:hypothetical protein
LLIDPGASDFSDFVHAAASLTKKITPAAVQQSEPFADNSTKRRRTPAPTTTQGTTWPKLDDRKRRDTPGYRGTVPPSDSTDGCLRAPSRSKSPALSRLRASTSSPVKIVENKRNLTSPCGVSAPAPAVTQSSFQTNATATPIPQLNDGIPNCGDIRRSKSPFKAQTPPRIRYHQSPAKIRDATAREVPGLRSSFVVKDGRKSPFRQGSFQSISNHVEEPIVPQPLRTFSPLTTSNDNPAHQHQKLPTVSTNREEWMDRTQSLSFVQSEVSFTPENVLTREDFGFDRDFQGFDVIQTKSTIDGFQSPKTERVVKACADSFDWDTDFHRAASPFKSRPTADQPINSPAPLSSDDCFISAIHMAALSTPKDSDLQVSSRRDPSPISAHRSIPKIARTSSTQSQGPQKTPPKAVPTNAILGSMLFRQTQTSNTPDNKSEDRNGSSHIGDSRSKDATRASFIGENRSRDTGSSMLSRNQSSFIVASRSKDKDELGPSRVSSKQTGYSKAALDKVPSAVVASDGSESNFSSVTEEASSFYKKSFGGRSPRWTEPAQTLVNNYNVRKAQLRMNTSPYSGTDHAPSNLQQFATSSAGPLCPSEKEHINVFLSEV